MGAFETRLIFHRDHPRGGSRLYLHYLEYYALYFLIFHFLFFRAYFRRRNFLSNAPQDQFGVSLTLLRLTEAHSPCLLYAVSPSLCCAPSWPVSPVFMGNILDDVSWFCAGVWYVSPSTSCRVERKKKKMGVRSNLLN